MSRLIYFDNAATSFPKPGTVLSDVKRCISRYCANPGRSTHRIALEAAEQVYEVRELVADFINAPSPSNIVFCFNATHALNIAIKGLIDHRCHVIISDLEHNSVIRPLATLERKLGVELSVFDSNLPPEAAIPPLIRDDTEFIVTTLASNVIGRVILPESLMKVARAYSLRVIADASQYLGHLPLDIQATPLDIVCAPAHKALFGIPGGGILAFGGDVAVDTLIEGGSGGDTFNKEMPAYLPERFEAGTVSLPSIIALGSGIKYLNTMGKEYVEERISNLTHRLGEILDSCGAGVYGCENGIASFEIPKQSSESLCMILDEAGIAVRGGLHCAPLIHRKMGTDGRGLVRVSLSVLNTYSELEKLHRVLKML